MKKEDNSCVEFTGETDRVYINGAKDGENPMIINNQIQVHGSTSMCDIVVWNPWETKAKTSIDIGEENYPKFVCVEVGHVSRSVRLDASQKWIGSHRLTYIK